MNNLFTVSAARPLWATRPLPHFEGTRLGRVDAFWPVASALGDRESSARICLSSVRERAKVGGHLRAGATRKVGHLRPGHLMLLLRDEGDTCSKTKWGMCLYSYITLPYSLLHTSIRY